MLRLKLGVLVIGILVYVGTVAGQDIEHRVRDVERRLDIVETRQSHVMDTMKTIEASDREHAVQMSDIAATMRSNLQIQQEQRAALNQIATGLVVGILLGIVGMVLGGIRLMMTSRQVAALHKRFEEQDNA